MCAQVSLYANVCFCPHVGVVAHKNVQMSAYSKSACTRVYLTELSGRAGISVTYSDELDLKAVYFKESYFAVPTWKSSPKSFMLRGERMQ